MTKPDEALLWAREHWATVCDEDGFPDLATAYRAGAAASEARIAELETNVAELAACLEAALATGYRPWVQQARDLIAKVRSQRAARNPLKEADQ